MTGSLAFTLYEVFGYLLPGSVALQGILLLYWTFVVPGVPLGFATYHPGLVTWTALVIASYFLGHTVQGVSNVIYKHAEDAALATSDTTPAWLLERATKLARTLLGLGISDPISARWVVRTLDEYSVQAGELGDRDVFVYREGFYRGSSVAFIFLSIALLVRAWYPGASIQFTKGLFYVSTRQLLSTALVISAVGRVFIWRYGRFADYRITRAVLAALVRDNLPKDRDSTQTKLTAST